MTTAAAPTSAERVLIRLEPATNDLLHKAASLMPRHDRATDSMFDNLDQLCGPWDRANQCYKPPIGFRPDKASAIRFVAGSLAAALNREAMSAQVEYYVGRHLFSNGSLKEGLKASKAAQEQIIAAIADIEQKCAAAGVNLDDRTGQRASLVLSLHDPSKSLLHRALDKAVDISSHDRALLPIFYDIHRLCGAKDIRNDGFLPSVGFHRNVEESLRFILGSLAAALSEDGIGKEYRTKYFGGEIPCSNQHLTRGLQEIHASEATILTAIQDIETQCAKQRILILPKRHAPDDPRVSVTLSDNIKKLLWDTLEHGKATSSHAAIDVAGHMLNRICGAPNGDGFNPPTGFVDADRAAQDLRDILGALARTSREFDASAGMSYPQKYLRYNVTMKNGLNANPIDRQTATQAIVEIERACLEAGIRLEPAPTILYLEPATNKLLHEAAKQGARACAPSRTTDTMLEDVGRLCGAGTNGCHGSPEGFAYRAAWSIKHILGSLAQELGRKEGTAAVCTEYRSKYPPSNSSLRAGLRETEATHDEMLAAIHDIEQKCAAVGVDLSLRTLEPAMRQ